VKTCFISAPFGVNLNILNKVLISKGIKPIFTFQSFPIGLSIQRELIDAIKRSDLVIGVIGKDYLNDNTYFELGYAFALDKRTIIVKSPEVKLATDLSGFQYIQASVNDETALSFAFDQILAASFKKKAASKKQFTKSKPLGPKADDLIKRLDVGGGQISELELQNISIDLFRESGITLITQSRQKDWIVDFAIWVDELDSALGNPILVEIKRNLQNKSQINSITDRLKLIMEKSNSRSTLVLYHESNVRKLADIPSVPTILFIEIRELLQKLEYNSFGDIILRLRNRIAHGVDS
jgi:hypothetical protein